MLYPLKFRPILKERVWGGSKLKELGKKIPTARKIGESWDLSAVEGDASIVSNGFLKGNNIQELVEVYMGDLVGERVYEKFGVEFPLLIKLIDTQEALSIQVHPDDKVALERHNTYGKSEMWYVVERDQGAVIYLGFNRDLSRKEYMAAVENGTLPSLLNKVEVEVGDRFLIPAGTIHAIGAGVMLVEVQQTSDITYRVDDWGRMGLDGKPRELHRDLAKDVINYNAINVDPIRDSGSRRAGVVLLEDCNHFTVNRVEVEDELIRDYSNIDSFIIYVALNGTLQVGYSEGVETLNAGETMLIPAQEERIRLSGDATILEVFIR